MKSTIAGLLAATAGSCPDGRAGPCAGRHQRLPHHQDRHQPVLREDARRRRGQGRRAQHHADEPTPAGSTATTRARSRPSRPASPTAPRASCSVPSDSSAIVDSVQQARDAGILVIALDTPLDPIDAADATLATDNFQAGRADRPVGRRPARRGGGERPASRSSTSPSASPPWTCCATRASWRASASTRRTPTSSATRTTRASPATT